MGVGMDKAAGISMLSISAFIFMYYTIWVIILPFVDEDHEIHKYFLPRYYAIAIPIAICALAAFGLGVFVLVLFLPKSPSKAKKSS